LKKRTKKLLAFGVTDPASVQANEQKSFASFLQKRRPFFPKTVAPRGGRLKKKAATDVTDR
jgi:hypothetical protein